MTAIAALERPDPLQRARAGDHEAFGELVAANEAMVYSIAWHFFGDPERAADIAQDIFLQLYRNLGSISTPTHLVHWLRQVTTRRCIDERSEEHTSELQSRLHLLCRLLLEKKKEVSAIQPRDISPLTSPHCARTSRSH